MLYSEQTRFERVVVTFVHAFTIPENFELTVWHVLIFPNSEDISHRFLFLLLKQVLFS
jgi:hypothetical protein